ncbi:RER1 family protein [Gregarina niphandrodes]|uniref:Protein RER1 n=1 Tax=Gregarina niphandrodes TaxID=110365 RepID=A0A023BCG5_GRENI|nr:RER1 family protein [Gregarina niphandrodes]EZG83602.1 RER1 family protein [Gregarina niphandrodes]|eukprot:XP_011128923.1 RER1 family protein [Gregarina niphandrodes]
MHEVRQSFHQYLDKTTIWAKSRWASLAAVVTIFALRVVLAEGWYVSAYCLAVFILNLFIAFITPQKDPETDEYILPVGNADGEFRPFVRKLPEFHFWSKSMYASSLALMSTCSRIFDLPVFWPVLLFYFIFVFILTMKHQISDMIQHGYMPWSARKVRYYGDIGGGR